MSHADLLFPPSPNMQVHASSILVLDNSTWLVAWYAGSHEGADDSAIHIMRRRGGDTTTVRIAPRDPLPHWNPVLAPGPDGRTWLFFKRGHRIDEWVTWTSQSTDDGLTWSEPMELVPGDASGGRGPIRQAPVLVGGLWIAPGSVEVWEPQRWDSFMDVSADQGRSWQQVMLPLNHSNIRGAGCIQPCLVAQPDGTLVTLTRSTAGCVFRSSTGDPYSWPPLEPTGLPNNNSGIAAAGLDGGRIVLVHNDDSSNWGARSRLVWSVSADRGRTWSAGGFVADGSGSGPMDGRPSHATATGVVTTGEGEYSYPALAVVGDELWVTYTWQRRSIALARLPVPGQR